VLLDRPWYSEVGAPAEPGVVRKDQSKPVLREGGDPGPAGGDPAQAVDEHDYRAVVADDPDPQGTDPLDGGR